jgi:hypothetical protein
MSSRPNKQSKPSFNLTREQVQAIYLGPKRAAMALSILEFVANQKQGATCDECMVALGLLHQSASVRYSELVKTGCLVFNGKLRSTQSGAKAKVHQVSPTGDFKKYLALAGKTKKPGLSEFEQDILTLGKDFWSRWHKARSKKSREEAAVALVTRLASLSHKQGG